MRNKLLLLLLLILSYSTAIFAQADKLSSYTVPDTILIASEPDYPPYCLVNDEGEADGFSIDLFKAAAKAVGLQVNIKIGIWNVIKQDLAEGKIDALPLVGKTPEREELYDFTMPYLSLHGAVFVRKGTTDIHSLADLKTKEIVVMKGDNAEEFVRREQLSDKIFTTNTFEEAFQQLAAGKYDALITQRVLGLHLLDDLKINSIQPLDFQIPQFRQDFCFAVQKGNEELLSLLNEGLSIVIANDTFQEIHVKWFGHTFKEKVSPHDFLRIFGLFFIPVFIVLALVSIFLLKKEVKRRTKLLKKEIAKHEKTMQALKQSEKKYHDMIYNLMEGFYNATIDGYLLDYNKEFINILKLDGKKNYAGKKVLEFWQNPEKRKTYIDTIIRQGYVKNYESQAVCGNGEIIEIVINSRLITDKKGKPLRIEGSILDITKRKKTEQELRLLKDKLETQVAQRTAELEEKIEKLDESEKAMLFMVEDLNRTTEALQKERQKLLAANQELEAFTYSVSHDLRAPLRAIDGYGKFLLEDYNNKLDAEGKRFINVIRKNSCKMDQLITDLLNLSRINRTKMNMHEVNMKNVAASMYQEVASKEEKQEFEVIIHDIPNAVCDINLIKIVWRNLIDNALKYSSKSARKKIIINAEMSDNHITYFIKDEGAGFNEKYIDKLFGVFQRLHKEEEFEGTGVGLVIVKRVIVRHGGKVWAKGKVNEGATFYFTLPKIMNMPKGEKHG